MRILYLSPRYGAEVFGGAERMVAEFAERMATRGHETHVLTSCARSYNGWADVDSPGDSVENGVVVHRLAGAISRSAGLNAAVMSGAVTRWYLQDEWSRQVGPALRDSGRWLQRNSGDFDIVAPATYQHRPTVDAATHARAPVVLHPTAHPEPTLGIEIFDLMARRAAAMSLLTPEEKMLVEQRFPRSRALLRVIGMGVDPLETTDDDKRNARAAFGLGDAPYLVCVGRIDPNKGSMELFDFFSMFKERHPGHLNLVFAGEAICPIGEHPDVVVTGRLTTAMRNAVVAGAVALVQPSFYESFSLVLAEGWRFRLPALVQGRSDVLTGQCLRSGGGLPYCGYAEFEAALALLIGDTTLRARLGGAGHEYVARHYEWHTVLDRYEELLAKVISSRPSARLR